MPFLILSQSHNKPWSELHKFYHNHSFTSFQTNWISSDKIRFGKILTERSRDVSIDLRLNLPFWAITCWQNECRLVPLPFRANPSPWPAPPFASPQSSQGAVTPYSSSPLSSGYRTRKIIFWTHFFNLCQYRPLIGRNDHHYKITRVKIYHINVTCLKGVLSL